MSLKPDLIETMLWTRAAGIWLLEEHLARLAESSAALGYAHDRHEVRRAIDRAVAESVEDRLRLRLTQSPRGAISISCTRAPEAETRPWRVSVAAHRLDSGDLLLRHKTTRREFYDEGRRQAACEKSVDEAIFLNERGEVCDGSITSVFVERDGTLLTPALGCGLLAGVLRAQLLREGRAKESVLHPEDLQRGLYLGNSVRGLVPAVLV
jgi:branched-subunit amino acid aminotransferase/4-amino-4-deoxychorismate lyase